LVSAYEKDYLLAEQGNDAPKAPHHKSRERKVSFDNPGERVTCRFKLVASGRVKTFRRL
jgi:hypothetical protein